MRIVIIPIGLILRILTNTGQDSRKAKMSLYVILGALLYVVLAMILFVVLGSGRLGGQSFQYAMPVCGSAVLVLVVAVVGLGVVVSQKSEPTSSATWLSISDAAKYLQISDTEVMALIKGGKLLARKVDGQYRLEQGILQMFSTKNAG